MHSILKDEDFTFFSISQNERPVILPLFSSVVPAGFPSPADDYIEQELDLNKLMVKNPAATFFVRVEGESMCEAHIHTGDILVIDRSAHPGNGKIVLATLNGEFTVKRLLKKGQELYLVAENPHFEPIAISQSMDFQIFGVVTYVIHQAL